MEAHEWGAVASALVAVAAIGAVFFVVRRRRLITDLPTSKVMGVFIGLNELEGTVECEQPLTSPMSATPSVWYHYKVEEEYRRQSTSTDSQGRTSTSQQQGWQHVASDSKCCPFVLRDDTGIIGVDPDGAKVHPTMVLSQTVHRGDPIYNRKGTGRSVRGSTGRRRIQESAVAVGAEVYLLGPAHLPADADAPVIAKNRRVGPLLLSTRGQERVVRGLAAWLIAWFALVFLAAGAAPFLLAGGGDADPVLLGLALVVPLVVMGLGWLLISYNGLVQLRQREARAWSLIEVQLERRHDLIPRLAAAVEAYARHERSTLEEVTALRSGDAGQVDHVEGAPDAAEVVAGTNAADEQTSAIRRLMALSEAYPELRADTVFAELRDELSRTEDRIAMARSYFNDSVTALADRTHRFPENLVAALGRFQAKELFAAEGFERAVPTIADRPDGLASS
ncbi:MAG: LemA family protein [Acidimicrobiia bacterium]|nr:LemA family protein [Acidimicrobiia bacterium]